ncbi:MAG: hypothetical protein AAGE01_21865 [Pseudomonadota bacterium]
MAKRFLFLSGECGAVSERDRRNSRRYLMSLGAWALSYVGCAWLVTGERLTIGPVAIAVALLPSILAVMAVLAFVHYLKHADEMQRLIELQALALAVLAGFVIWPGLSLLGALGVDVDPVSEFQPMVMIAAYAIGSAWSRRQFL